MMPMMRTTLLAGLTLGLLCSWLPAQTTQPAAAASSTLIVDRAALEIRANQEFSRGQYALALPMLRKLAEMTKDQPDALGPIEEKIRVCEKNLGNAAPLDTAALATPSLNASRKPHAPPQSGQVLEMPIKELGNFDFDAAKGGNIPKDVQALSGSKVRFRGYMIPMDQAANITQFALVPDLFACCFGQPPQLQHTIVANCPKGKAVSYYPDEITVEGTLKVAEKKDEGFIVSIFELDVSSVKPSPK
jgi:hypothetical protein